MIVRAAVLAIVALVAGCHEEAPPVEVPPVIAAPAVTPPPLDGSPSLKPAPEIAAAPAVPTIAPLPPSPAGVPRDAVRYQRDLISNARAVWGLNAPVATFAGQVHQESTWKADARSRTGAAGLAQFMPRTADWISGLYKDELGENEPLNPAWALRALVRYDKLLRDGVKRFDSECDRMKFALSDYNGGAGWRMKRQARSAQPGHYETSAAINPGISEANQRENYEYALRIVNRWQPLYSTWGIGVCA